MSQRRAEQQGFAALEPPCSCVLASGLWARTPVAPAPPCPLSQVSEQSGKLVTRKVFGRDLEVPPHHSGQEALLGWAHTPSSLVLMDGGLGSL